MLDERGLDHVIYNAVSSGTNGRNVVSVARRRMAWMLRYAVAAPERVIYVCSARLEVWLLAATMAMRGKQVIIRLRNVALPDYLANPRTRALASWAMRRATYVVAVSPELAAAARAAGVPEERIIHQPGFLPPACHAPGEDGLSPSQRDFLSGRHPVLAANGKVDVYAGVDLYGFDHLVELVGRLRPSYPAIGLVVAFWDHLPKDEPRLAALHARAAELGVSDSILWHTESWPFVPVLAHAHLFLRPTVTDGDANSVREALFIGVPAIASDAVARPTGTICVKTRDLEALIAAATATLHTPPPRTPRCEIVDLAKIDVYLNLFERLAS
ncbi:hypothetical protein [Bauldia litoralis]|nr:hypothetical protein [Bauldia litoralis]